MATIKLNQIDTLNKADTTDIEYNKLKKKMLENEKLHELKSDLEELNNDFFGIKDAFADGKIDASELPIFFKSFEDVSNDIPNIMTLGNNIGKEINQGIHQLAGNALDNTDETLQSFEEQGIFNSIMNFFTSGFYLDKIFKIFSSFIGFFFPSPSKDDNLKTIETPDKVMNQEIIKTNADKDSNDLISPINMPDTID